MSSLKKTCFPWYIPKSLFYLLMLNLEIVELMTILSTTQMSSRTFDFCILFRIWTDSLCTPDFLCWSASCFIKMIEGLTLFFATDLDFFLFESPHFSPFFSSMISQEIQLGSWDHAFVNLQTYPLKKREWVWMTPKLLMTID